MFFEFISTLFSAHLARNKRKPRLLFVTVKSVTYEKCSLENGITVLQSGDFDPKSSLVELKMRVH